MWISQKGHFGIMNEAINEIEGISDRAGAIVAAALVEDHLAILLRHSFHQDEQILREMFDGTAPLVSFSAKVKMAFMIGIISKRAYKNLEYIRKIRNMFAHEASGVTFETAPICDWAMNLDLHTYYNLEVKFDHPITDALRNLNLLDDIRDKLDTPKYRYIATCRIFLAHFTVLAPLTPPKPVA